MDISAGLRKLAKSDSYQSLYSQAKELNLNIFRNTTDYTTTQIEFLGFLGLYSSLYVDIYMGEVDNTVLNNEIFEDSYMYWKSKKNTKNNKEMQDSVKKTEKKQGRGFSMAFMTKKKD